MTRRWVRAVALSATFAAAAAPAGAAVPTGFTDTVLATLASPTAIAFTPDGRMLVTTQPGRLRVYAGGALLGTPALDLSAVTCANSERGMLGVAVDPNFASNHFIYVYYTFKGSSACATGSSTSPANRVSRLHAERREHRRPGERAHARRRHPGDGRQPQRRRRAVRQGRQPLHLRRRWWLRLPRDHQLRGQQRRRP